MTTKVLNLYAGIGGNRKRWEDVDVTAVELDDRRVECYRDHFPEDCVVEADAHKYLLDHYDEYDFIWASPPCPTHSEMRKIFHQDDNPKYPDMRLYQEILFLKHTFTGDWVVENVVPYYEPLINADKRGRHLFWSNFYIPEIDMDVQGVRGNTDSGRTLDELEDYMGFDTSGYGLTQKERRKTINNCVHPKLGEHVFKAATTDRQTTTDAWVDA